MKTEFRMQNAECRMPSAAPAIMPHAPRFPHHVHPPQYCYGGRATEDGQHAPYPRPSPLAPRPSERGVALVITLVLLSVITFMAVTFLVVSRSQHGSVATETDQTIARLAADSAIERAIAATPRPHHGLDQRIQLRPAGLHQLYQPGWVRQPAFAGPLNVNYNYPKRRSPQR